MASINACIVGYMLFVRKMPFDVRERLISVRTSPWQVTFIALILVLSLAIMGKLIFHKGTPLRGGMPSGHAAVAFSIWTVISFLTNNLIVIVLSFVMAFLIARHRVKSSIHTITEVSRISLADMRSAEVGYSAARLQGILDEWGNSYQGLDATFSLLTKLGARFKLA